MMSGVREEGFSVTARQRAHEGLMTLYLTPAGQLRLSAAAYNWLKRQENALDENGKLRVVVGHWPDHRCAVIPTRDGLRVDPRTKGFSGRSFCQALSIPPEVSGQLELLADVEHGRLLGDLSGIMDKAERVPAPPSESLGGSVRAPQVAVHHAPVHAPDASGRSASPDDVPGAPDLELSFQAAYTLLAEWHEIGGKIVDLIVRTPPFLSTPPDEADLYE